MKQIFLAIVLLSSLSLSAQNDNVIKVQGKSSVEVTPDRVKFILNFEVKSEDREGSISKLNQQLDDVIANLVNAGLAQDSIRTENFRTQFRNNQYNPNQTSFFSSSQMLSFVMLANSEDIVSVLNILSETKGDFAFYPTAFVSEELKNQKMSDLLSSAFQDAKSKATLLANAGEFQLGEVKSVDFGDDQNQVNFQIRGNSSMAENDISFRKEENFGDYILPKKTLRSSVRVVYYIRQ